MRAAYRARAQALHPDRHPDRAAEATREFQELTQAYRELTRADPSQLGRRGSAQPRADAFLRAARERERLRWEAVYGQAQAHITRATSEIDPVPQTLEN